MGNKGQSVPVTKDVMKLKAALERPEWSEEYWEYVELINTPFSDQLDQAKAIVDKFGPWESEVFPKFVIFLAKKRRLKALYPICQEFVAFTYMRASIEPVTVTSAKPLTEDQVELIKNKMKEKLEVTDIKLIQKLDQNLLSGFKLEWGYVDPEDTAVGAETLDFSLKTQLDNAAIANGGIP